MNKKILLTFEYDIQNEMLEIHANPEGIKKLIAKLSKILETGDDSCHDHLLTPDWGGDELSNEKQCKDNILINHVKIFKW